MKKRLCIALCILAAVVLTAIAACVIVWNTNEFTMAVTLSGNEEITLEYGETYTEAGAEASFQGSLLCREAVQTPVYIQGEVDTSTLGTYTVTYSTLCYTNYFLIHREHTATATRTVHVVDTQAPQITLVSDPDTYTLPHTPYAEEGFTAADNYDGDITDRVSRVEADGTVTYTVCDSSGNTTQVVRDIVYYDPEPPVLTLLGDSILLVPQGEAYEDPGYEVSDNCDTELTVQVTGQVDTQTTGVYTLTYSVSDTYGNTATASRQVTVRAPTVWPAAKTIYLTFDDGPGRYTEELLDILAKYDVKATFFVVETSRLYLVKRMAAEGHKVALHSATHDYAEVYASEEAYFADLERIRDAVAQYTDQPLTLIRFPGGGSNTVSRRHCEGIMTLLARRIAEEGYYYFDWNVDSNDAGGATTADEVFQNVTTGISYRNVSMVLMHDIKGYSVDAVERIIVWALENGYTFRTVDETTPGFHYNINN